MLGEVAHIDFETYSEAGSAWDPARNRWAPLTGAQKRGLPAVGAAAYAEHPSTCVLTLSRRLGAGAATRWRPDAPPPADLFAWGGLYGAHNVMFERLIWHHVCTRLYGWPPVPPIERWVCTMATARVNNLPGALGDLGPVLGLDVLKDADGTRLLGKFSQPRTPTGNDPRARIRPEDDAEDGERLYAYCDRDVMVEAEAERLMLPMAPAERRFWCIDQRINWRGVGADREGVATLRAVVDELLEERTARCLSLTGGVGPGQVKALVDWIAARGYHLPSLDAEAVEEALARPDLTDEVREVLEIRAATASASVKKLYAMQREMTRGNRLCNLYTHHGARTGRPTGGGVQPTNMPRGGPDLLWCPSCKRPQAQGRAVCAWCGALTEGGKRSKWSWKAVEPALEAARGGAGRMRAVFGDALLTVAGCLRGMFVAAPGHDLIASDYSAIEAVVAAALAGEQWRLDTFERGEDIYLVSAAKITNTPVEEYRRHKAEHGEHHPHRQKIGKVAELASGFGGWIGAWLAFGATGGDDEIKAQIIAWRDASPNIVEMWGGQGRGWPGSWRYVPERYGLEGAAVCAIEQEGVPFSYRGITYERRGDVLFCRLLSGRELQYHHPRLTPSARREGELAITYTGWNSNPKYGAMGWVPMETYAGKLFENVVQATAHDIQRHGIELLEAAGYPIVLHVYDENVAEVPEGFGSVEEFERLMAQMPDWATGWPIRATGGWRGKRYRKG